MENLTNDQLIRAGQHLYNAEQQIKAAMGILGLLGGDGTVPVGLDNELISTWWNVWAQRKQLSQKLQQQILQPAKTA